jgi:16S rRNA (uracil1498-N3)-methyltransferase
MNGLVLFEHERKDDDHYFIKSDERVEHVIQHLKLKAQDKLSVIELNQGTGVALIESTKSGLLLRIQKRESITPTQLHLCVGLSRPPTMKKILEHATTMGVGHFHLCSTELSEKSYAQSKMLEEVNIQKLMLLGLSQARTLAHLPTVTHYKRLTDFQSPSVKQKILLSPHSKTNLLQIELDLQSPVTLAIGPERGFSTKDEDYFINQGFERVSLGPSILRVEYAVASILAQIELLKS